MFTAYFDESVTDKGYAVAGCIAAVEQWIHFEREWKLLLHEAGLSAFHMKDFVHSNREFHAWRGDEQRRRTFLERAIGIIARRIEISVGIVIDREDYEAFCSTEARRQHFQNPYTAASLLCLLQCTTWGLKRQLSFPIGIVFDNGNRFRAHFHRAYDDAKQNPDFAALIGGIAFGDDVRMVPLQAADLVVYEISKVWTQMHSGDKRDLRRSMAQLLHRVPQMWKHVTSAELRQLADVAGIP